MFTLEDALKLEVFQQAQIVAGAKALKQRIKWVHIIDVPEYAAWVEEGVLLLTTAFGVKDNAATQIDLVPTLVEKGVVGLVVALTDYFQQVPREMVAIANDLNFPIITVPYQIRFIDITKALFERIVSEQYYLLKRAAVVHETLTTLILEGKGFSALAEALATLIHHPVTFEDAANVILGHATLDMPVDAARVESIEHGRTSATTIAALREAGLLNEIQAGGRPVRLPPVPELGMTMERIVAPIVVGGMVLGYVWIISSDTPLEDIDRAAIEQAASVAALILLKDKEVQAAGHRVRGDLMDRILRSTGDVTPDLVADVERYGLNAECSHQILVVRFEHISPATLADRMHCLEQMGQQQSVPALIARRSDHLVALCEGVDASASSGLAKKIVDESNEADVEAFVGIGRPYASLAGMNASYGQAEHAVRIGRIFRPKERVLEFDDLGLLYWLDQLPSEAVPFNFYTDRIGALAAVDAAENTDLLRTLEMYLDAGGHAKEAARQLFIHRNTLFHRLARIKSVTSLDLENPMVCLNLHVALKHYRLRSNG